MSRLVDDLLDLASIDAGSLSLQPVAVAPRELLSEVRDGLGPQALDKGLTLIAEADAALPLIRCDRERIIQVLSNLVANAIKFTPAGGTVALRADLEPTDAAVRFTVTDTGPGIPEEMQEHAFDRHWHAKRTDRESHGLGLSIAKGIVESHGGEISVASPPGVGSVFRFSIPLEPLAGAPDRERACRKHRARADRCGRNGGHGDAAR
jgi:signal transduction histidine kinase